MKINDLVEFEGNYYLLLSDPFILEGQKNFYNLQVVKVVDLSNETIDLLKIKNNKIEDKINWNYISYRQILSESFIREFQDKVSWYSISCYKTLSESFIREFQNKVNWWCISKNKNISNEIREKFRLEGKFNGFKI